MRVEIIRAGDFARKSGFKQRTKVRVVTVEVKPVAGKRHAKEVSQ
jgi:hypothetical protein